MTFTSWSSATTVWEPDDYNYYKYGSCSPAYIMDGYYYFYWEMYINMDFNTQTPVVDHYKIEDIIPSDSPHKFITPTDNAAFSSQKNLHRIRIREYIGADDNVYDTPEKRYAKFKEDYNADGSENWANKFFKWNGNSGYFLPDSENVQELAGVDSGAGIKATGIANPVSDADYISDNGKTLSVDLGRVTRPTIISYYTIAEKEFAERALGSSSTVAEFKNKVRFYGEDSDFGENLAQVIEYSFAAGGGGTGSAYDKEFSFIKTDESGNALQGARFVLYDNASCTGIVQAMAVSDAAGRVRFTDLREGTYYMKEDVAPSGFVVSDKVYMVNLSEQGLEVFVGDEFTELLIEPVKIENSKLKSDGYLLIKKTDAITGESLEGAAFELFDGNILVKTVVLGGDGTVEWSTINPSESGYWLIEGLEPGKEYKIKEIIPPKGYLLNETEAENTRTAYASDSLTPETIHRVIFSNYTTEDALFTSRLKIIKTDSFGNLLKGAKFEVYSKSEPMTLVATADMSDTDTWVSDWLPRDEYVIFETVAPEGTTEILPKLIGDVELKGKSEEMIVLTVINTLSAPVEPSEPGKPIGPTKPSKPSGNGNSGATAEIKPSDPIDQPNANEDTVLTPELPIVHELYPTESSTTVDNVSTSDENINTDIPNDLSANKENPVTGDNTPYFAWWPLLIASASLSVSVLVFRHLSIRKKF